MITPPDAVDVAARRTRRLHRFVAVGLFGLLLVAVGLAIDAVLHARDPNLAGEEGLFAVENPGHLLLGLGMVATAVGLIGASSTLIAAGAGTLLHIGQWALGVGLVVLIVAMGYVAAGPGLGHSHGGNVAEAARIGIAVDVDRSRYPPAEAEALVALASSRSGSLDNSHHDHEHGGETSSVSDLSQEQREALEAQLAVAAQAVPDIDTAEEAEAAGYVQASKRAEGVGAHWVKWSLVDRPFDPGVPSMLLFEEVTHGEGPELVAYSYWVASADEPEGFVGETDAWHQHVGLCFEDGWLMNEEVHDRGSCAGDWINGSDLWMLHAWVVPGMENRLGVFANINPRFCERYCE